MKKLYYVNKNQELGIIDLPSFDACLPLKEPVIFVALRDGIQFIKEPPELFPFTDIERLIMGSDFFDMRYLKDSDYRKENSSICPVIPLSITILDHGLNGDFLEYGQPYQSDYLQVSYQGIPKGTKVEFHVDMGNGFQNYRGTYELDERIPVTKWNKPTKCKLVFGDIVSNVYEFKNLPTLAISYGDQSGLYWNYPFPVQVRKSVDGVIYTIFDSGPEPEELGVINETLFQPAQPSAWFKLIDDVNHVESIPFYYEMLT